MAGERKLSILVFGDTKRAQQALKGLDGPLNKLNSGVGRLGKTMAVGLGAGAAAGAAALTALTVQGVKSLARIERINTQTATAIKSTGGAARVTAKHVEDLAGSLENLTAMEAETVQEGANLLLTFTNIRNGVGKNNDIFDQAVKIMADMSIALGQDTKSSAIQLGKALNDPIKGVTALQRVGVSFTKKQKDQITTLVKTGKTMDAQRLILKELNTEFGGSGAAYAKTYEGRIKLLGHAFGTLQESIASGLLPWLEKIAGGLKSGLDYAQRFWDSLGRLNEWKGADFTGKIHIAWGKLSGRLDRWLTGYQPPPIKVSWDLGSWKTSGGANLETDVRARFGFDENGVDKLTAWSRGLGEAIGGFLLGAVGASVNGTDSPWAQAGKAMRDGFLKGIGPAFWKSMTAAAGENTAQADKERATKGERPKIYGRTDFLKQLPKGYWQSAQDLVGVSNKTGVPQRFGRVLGVGKQEGPLGKDSWAAKTFDTGGTLDKWVQKWIFDPVTAPGDFVIKLFGGTPAQAAAAGEKGIGLPVSSGIKKALAPIGGLLADRMEAARPSGKPAAESFQKTATPTINRTARRIGEKIASIRPSGQSAAAYQQRTFLPTVAGTAAATSSKLAGVRPSGTAAGTAFGTGFTAEVKRIIDGWLGGNTGIGPERVWGSVGKDTGSGFGADLLAELKDMAASFGGSGLTGHTAQMAGLFTGQFGASVISGFRPGAKIRDTGRDSLHASGRGIDLSGGNLWAAFHYAASHASALGLQEALYKDQAWSVAVPREHWNTNAQSRADHQDHLHLGFRYDQGGYLQPGLSVVQNKTGKPEPVLTDAQWQKLIESRGGTTVNATIHVHESQNPQATAKAVLRELEKLARSQRMRAVTV